MIVPGLIALALYPELERADLAFPALAFDLLPIGLRGVVAAALIAAIMSSLDSALNAAGALFTMDFVKPIRPAAPEADRKSAVWDRDCEYGCISGGPLTQ